MNKAVVLLGICCLLAGCASKAKAPKYEGKTQLQWIDQSRLADPGKRIEAVKVLSGFVDDQAAMDRVKTLAMSDGNSQVRAAALNGCYMLLSHEDLRTAIGKLLADQQANGKAILGPGFRRGVVLLGVEAKGLEPELQRIRDSAKDEDIREVATNALHEIDPKYPAYQPRL